MLPSAHLPGFSTASTTVLRRGARVQRNRKNCAQTQISTPSAPRRPDLSTGAILVLGRIVHFHVQRTLAWVEDECIPRPHTRDRDARCDPHTHARRGDAQTCPHTTQAVARDASAHVYHSTHGQHGGSCTLWCLPCAARGECSTDWGSEASARDSQRDRRAPGEQRANPPRFSTPLLSLSLASRLPSSSSSVSQGGMPGAALLGARLACSALRLRRLYLELS